MRLGKSPTKSKFEQSQKKFKEIELEILNNEIQNISCPHCLITGSYKSKGGVGKSVKGIKRVGISCYNCNKSETLHGAFMREGKNELFDELEKHYQKVLTFGESPRKNNTEKNCPNYLSSDSQSCDSSIMNSSDSYNSSGDIDSDENENINSDMIVVTPIKTKRKRDSISISPSNVELESNIPHDTTDPPTNHFSNDSIKNLIESIDFLKK